MTKVVLSHAGIQYSYQLALALQEIGSLERFYTTIYCHKDHWIYRILKRTPGFSSSRIFEYLNRRQSERISSDLIYSNPWPELFLRTSRFLLGKNYFTKNTLLHWENRMFDYYVSTQLRKASFDMFIGLSGSALYSLKQAKKLGKIAILDQHDIHYKLAVKLLEEEIKLAPEFSTTIPYWPPSQPYLKCLQEEMEVADFIIVPSTFSLQSHLDAGIPKKKLFLIPRATEVKYESLCKYKYSNGKFHILFVGNITQRKGIKYLLDAVRQLNMHDIELTMIGDIIGSSNVLKPYKGHFKWVGYVLHDKLKSYFEKAAVLVLPSIYDAFGLSVLEAMATGLPVIVSENTAAGSDIVREGVDGYVIPIRDVNILKDRLLRLRDNEEMRKTMGINATQRVRQFNWDSYVDRMRHFLKQLQGTL